MMTKKSQPQRGPGFSWQKYEQMGRGGEPVSLAELVLQVHCQSRSFHPMIKNS